jgi:hypothetical protein
LKKAKTLNVSIHNATGEKRPRKEKIGQFHQKRRLWVVVDCKRKMDEILLRKSMFFVTRFHEPAKVKENSGELKH